MWTRCAKEDLPCEMANWGAHQLETLAGIPTPTPPMDLQSLYFIVKSVCCSQLVSNALFQAIVPWSTRCKVGGGWGRDSIADPPWGTEVSNLALETTNSLINWSANWLTGWIFHFSSPNLKCRNESAPWSVTSTCLFVCLLLWYPTLSPRSSL